MKKWFVFSLFVALVTTTAKAQTIFSFYDGMMVQTQGYPVWFNYNLLTNKLMALGQPSGFNMSVAVMGFAPMTNQPMITLVDVANFIATNRFDKVYRKSNSAPVIVISTTIPAFNTPFTNNSGTRNIIEANLTCAAVLAGSSAAGIVVNGREEAQTSAGNILNTAPGMLAAYVGTNDVWWITNHLTGIGSTATINTFTIKVAN